MTDLSETKKIIMREPPNKRSVTNSKNWCVILPEEQLDIIRNLDSGVVDIKVRELIEKELHNKLNGYKSQDVKKNKYSEELFIPLVDVLSLFIECENKCFYCSALIHILYENAREPKQWTLERVDNEMGHNKGNVMIACLECNLRRGTMYHERFSFTKQLRIEKK